MWWQGAGVHILDTAGTGTHSIQGPLRAVQQLRLTFHRQCQSDDNKQTMCAAADIYCEHGPCNDNIRNRHGRQSIDYNIVAENADLVPTTPLHSLCQLKAEFIDHIYSSKLLS